MLYTIANLDDVLSKSNDCSKSNAVNCFRSSNPYDYLRLGYFVDNAALYGGKNNVSYNCNFSGNSSGFLPDFTNK